MCSVPLAPTGSPAAPLKPRPALGDISDMGGLRPARGLHPAAHINLLALEQPPIGLLGGGADGPDDSPPQLADCAVQDLRALQHVVGIVPGALGLVRDVGVAAGHLIDRGGGLGHVARDLGGGRALLLHRRGDRIGDAR